MIFSELSSFYYTLLEGKRTSLVEKRVLHRESFHGNRESFSCHKDRKNCHKPRVAAMYEKRDLVRRSLFCFV